jgi:hypothetical protein
MHQSILNCTHTHKQTNKQTQTRARARLIRGTDRESVSGNQRFLERAHNLCCPSFRFNKIKLVEQKNTEGQLEPNNINIQPAANFDLGHPRPALSSVLLGEGRDLQ